MVTDSEKMIAELDRPYVLITDKKITSIQDIIGLLEAIVQEGRPLLIIADDIEGEAMATLVLNKLRGTFNVVAVKAPGFGDRRQDLLEDIAILTGATVISEKLGNDIKEASIDMLGSAESIKIDKDSTVIVDGGGAKENLDARIKQIKGQIENSDSDFDKEKLQERLAKLSGGVAVIEVGAATEVELKEKKLRIEDALAATRAGVAEGMVAGGGTVLIDSIAAVNKYLEGLTGDKKTGAMIIAKALEEPVKQIAENAGVEGSVVVAHVKDEKDGIGYDALNGEYVEMIKAGIVDPAKVTRSAIQNSASVAAMILTTEAAVVDIKEDEPQMPMGPGPGMY